MCGIAGFVGAAAPSEIESTDRIINSLVHRGPDGFGTYRDDFVVLANSRLSIIDLEGGWQPLYNEDESLVLIANAEIYNYLELQEELRARGHRLRTASDCETILHLYEEMGPDCVLKLRGMFAFALWDKRQKRLMLARDRFGEKPLYLHETVRGLRFSSELRALVASGKVDTALDPGAIHSYFCFGFVPDPATPLKAVRKLPAGHRLIVDAAPFRVREERYWSLLDVTPRRSNDPIEETRAALDDTARLTIRSDVPVGVALSGGVDSTAVAAFSQHHYGGKMSAITLGYPGKPDSDERAQARETASHLGLNLVDIEISTERATAIFPKVARLKDDPIADFAGINFYEIMRVAHGQGIRVMLDGVGGDELFWGYYWLAGAAREIERKRLMLASGQRPSLHSMLEFKNLSNYGPGLIGFRGWFKDFGGLRSAWENWRALGDAPREHVPSYDLSPGFRSAWRRSLSFLSEDTVGDGLKPFNWFNVAEPWPPTGLLLTEQICSIYMREVGLVQTDRLGMANSVETRTPLVDHKFAETILGLRLEEGNWASGKSWLRKAASTLVPPSIANRRKVGFTPPYREWHEGIVRAYGDILVNGELVGLGILKKPFAERLAEQGRPIISSLHPAHLALTLEFWLQDIRRAATSPSLLNFDCKTSVAQKPKMPEQADIWLIGRIDQMAVVAERLAGRGRLKRWDSPVRFRSNIERTLFGWKYPNRMLPNDLDAIKGAHYLPELIGLSRNFGIKFIPPELTDIVLDVLAARRMPRGARLLHGQHSYCLRSGRRARKMGTVFLLEILSQLHTTRRDQLMAEYNDHGLHYPDSDHILSRTEATIQFADGVLVPSASLVEPVTRFGLPESRIFVESYESSAERHLAALGRPPRTKGAPLRLLFIGSITIEKGLKYLLESFAAFRTETRSDVTLTLVGARRPDADRYLAALPAGVTWVGSKSRTELRSILMSHHAMVFPSLSEGCPLAVSESLSAGLPVIVTPTAAAVVREGIDGFVVPPRDSAAILSRLRLFGDEGRLSVMSAAAREGSRRRHAMPYGARVEAVYERLLSLGPRPNDM